MKRNPNQTNGFLLLTADKEKVTIYGVKGINKPRLLYQSSTLPRVAKSKDLALQVFFTAHLILEKRKICTTLASNRPCRWRLRRLADMVSFLTFYWLFSGVSRSLNCSSRGARKVQPVKLYFILYSQLSGRKTFSSTILGSSCWSKN